MVMKLKSFFYVYLVCVFSEWEGVGDKISTTLSWGLTLAASVPLAASRWRHGPSPRNRHMGLGVKVQLSFSRGSQKMEHSQQGH